MCKAIKYKGPKADKYKAKADKYRTEKSNALKKIVSERQPDVIFGDFNSVHPDTINDAKPKERICSTFEKAFATHPGYKNLDAEGQKLFQAYATDGHKTLEELGYNKSYTHKQIGVTSFYGSTVDWFYSKKGITACKYRNIEMMNNQTISVTRRPKKFTDHNAVYVEFNL